MAKTSATLAALLLLGLGGARAAHVAEPSRAELTRQVEALDQAFFGAFNQCRIEQLAGLVAEDLEFFHEKTGLMRSRQAFLDSVRKNVCQRFRREPLPGTMTVFPLEGFGAIQMGEHKFCPLDSGRCEGKGRYVHVWHRLDEGRWELMRVLSYEHLPLSE